MQEELETSGDEIETAVSAAQMLKERIYEASKYTDQLGEGNLESEISFDGEDDKLGISLHNLKNVLINRREQEQNRVKEDEIRNWSTHGVALFNDILRMDNNNLEKLCLNIIRNIIQYLSANQGGIFLTDKDEEVDLPRPGCSVCLRQAKIPEKENRNRRRTGRNLCTGKEDHPAQQNTAGLYGNHVRTWRCQTFVPVDCSVEKRMTKCWV